MILIADSGTTNTEWCLIDDRGIAQIIITSGINPFYQESEDISAILKKEFTAAKNVDSIYFYGAGCINQEKKDIIRSALLNVFEVPQIFIGSDLLAAAHSLCLDQPGIVCILGTGSNSCYYNGEEIVDNVSPLGFILGDEGSGAVLGRKLIGDVLKKQLPQKIINDFFHTYQTTPAEILDKVYKQSFPSRYLAGYAKFLLKNIKYPVIENIIIYAFRDFVSRNLLQYPQIKITPIHFTGSIAFYFESQLRKVIEEHHLIMGKIERTPMDGLVKYHHDKTF